MSVLCNHCPCTVYTAVAALQPLRALIQASGVPLAGWTSSSSPEPCGAANCSTQQGAGIPQCAWEGVACQDGRVTTLWVDGCACLTLCGGNICSLLPSAC
jgi:hypothetical protein